jgi:NAD(P)-dependent dehydrogenase (short-subunit alcohol dehydrogenase family)
MHYFKKHPDTRSQLVLIGSTASYFECPPLYTYCTSKGGILGLMRCLRTQVLKENVTVNMVAPYLTCKFPVPCGLYFP